MSAVALSPRAVERVMGVEPRTYYLDLRRALADGSRGQTPFTPAVRTMLQLNERLRSLDASGGAAAEVARVASLAADFRSRVAGLPLDLFSTSPSNACTALSPRNASARLVFEALERDYGIWVCPNGGGLADRVFRVGHMGALTVADNAALADALADLASRGLV